MEGILFPKRKSTAKELEECLSNSFLAEEAKKTFSVPEVREVIGRISFALHSEKSGTMTLDETEEAYSKAAASLSSIWQLDSVKESKESQYWLKLFELHVNRHLQEIVKLVDNNKKKPLAQYDRLERDNLALKEEVTYLRQALKDTQSELSLFRSLQSPQPEGLADEWRTMKYFLEEWKSEAEEPPEWQSLADSLGHRLNSARTMIEDLSHLHHQHLGRLRQASLLKKAEINGSTGTSEEIFGESTEESHEILEQNSS